MRGNGSFPVVLGSMLALSLVHCGSDGSGGPPNFNAFLGTWSCDSTTTINVTKPSGVPQQKQTTMVTLEVTKSGANTVTVGEMGDSTCAAEIRIAGNSGTLAAGFTCDQGGQNIKVQSARVTATGDKLTGSRNASITGTTDTGDALTGTVTTSIDCTRLSGPPDADGGAGEGNTGSGAKAGSGGNTGSGATNGSGARPGSGGNTGPGDDAGSGGSTGSGGNAGSGGNGGSGNAGSANGGSGGGVNPPVDCTAEADCLTCCDDSFPAALKRLDQLLLDCVCQACSAECATSLCASTPRTPQSGDDCDTCVTTSIDTGGDCGASIASACESDKTCAPYASCLQSCP